MKIVIIGDSHSRALKKALAGSSQQELKDVIEIYTFAKIKNGNKVGDLTLEESASLVSTLTEKDVLISLTGGNQHNSISLIQHPEPFTISTSETSTINNVSPTLIPYHVIRSVFYRGLRGNDFKRISELKQVTKAQMWHMAATPPKFDNEHILKKHETDFASKGITSYGVSDPLLRLQIWHIQQDVTRSLCDELEISYMPFPTEALDERGFLATKYYAEDATHANYLFGELMITKIFNTFSEKAI